MGVKEVFALTTFFMLLIIWGTRASPVSRGRDDTSHNRKGVITEKVLSHLIHSFGKRSPTTSRRVRKVSDERSRRSPSEAFWSSEHAKIQELKSIRAFLNAIRRGNHNMGRKNGLRIKQRYLAKWQRMSGQA